LEAARNPFALGDFCIEGVEEADELVMPVALHVALIIVEDIETAKQVTNTARALLAAPELQQPFSERQYEYQHEYRRDSKIKASSQLLLRAVRRDRGSIASARHTGAL